ncbi:hypothetical protein CRUP_020235 [Coryphaenoides rupestris]|nr:hypothetical protein CRUP_020235 [Coryphaenoides rupestris]
MAADREVDVKAHGGPTRPPFACPFGLSVEPVLFLAMFSIALQAPLSTQYLWDRISEDLGYNGTKAGGCGNTSADPDPLQKYVETLTAHWNLYINLGGFALGVVTVTLLGSWSDQAGRRPVLIVPCLGLALQAAVVPGGDVPEAARGLLLLGRLLSGLSGDFNSVLAGCFSYVADTSDRRSRTFRCGGAGGLPGPGRHVRQRHRRAVASGTGVHQPLLAGAGHQPGCRPVRLPVCPRVRDARPQRQAPHHPPPPGRLPPLLWTRRRRRREHGGRGGQGQWQWLEVQVVALHAVLLLVVMVHFGSRELYVLYELSAPLCWGPALIGYGSAAQHLGYLSSLLGLRLLQLCLADSWVAVAGLASNMVGLAVIAFANNTQLMFTGYGLCFLFMATTPVLRSKLSKLVGPSEQGALFASVACVEGLSSLVASGLFNSIYPATLHLLKGFPFLFGAILLLIPTGIIG